MTIQNTTHDPAVVRMALISRLWDEYLDADAALRDYLSYCRTMDRVPSPEREGALAAEIDTARSAYFAAAGLAVTA